MKITYKNTRCDDTEYLHLPVDERPHSYCVEAEDDRCGDYSFRSNGQTVKPTDFYCAIMDGIAEYGTSDNGESEPLFTSPVPVFLVDDFAEMTWYDAERIQTAIRIVTSEPVHFLPVDPHTGISINTIEVEEPKVTPSYAMHEGIPSEIYIFRTAAERDEWVNFEDEFAKNLFTDQDKADNPRMALTREEAEFLFEPHELDDPFGWIPDCVLPNVFHILHYPNSEVNAIIWQEFKEYQMEQGEKIMKNNKTYGLTTGDTLDNIRVWPGSVCTAISARLHVPETSRSISLAFGTDADNVVVHDWWILEDAVGKTRFDTIYEAIRTFFVENKATLLAQSR